VGPPLAAGIAAIAAALGLLTARYAATRDGAAFRDRRVWLVGAPMLFSAIGFIVVGAFVLPTIPIAGALIAGWGVVEIAMVAIMLPRFRRPARSKPDR
jgi:hypothetical protein